MVHDRHGFDQFYVKYWSLARDAALNVLDSEADAEDVAQLVFTRLLQSGSWGSIQQPRSYVRTAVRREAFSFLRRPQALPLTESLERSLPGRSLWPDQPLVEAERRLQASRLIEQLSPRCQMVCKLVFLEGMSHREVAVRLDITIKAVEKQVARGCERLRKICASDKSLLSPISDKGGNSAARASIG